MGSKKYEFNERSPVGLLCDFKSRPIGIESRRPAFFWIMRHPDPNEVQTAYQILMASDPAILHRGHGDVWDSGKVPSPQSSNVPYGGTPLQAASIYYWKVRTWDKNDRAGEFSDPQMVVTALWNQWQAAPIWGDADGFLLLRKIIELSAEPIDHAFVYVTARNAWNSTFGTGAPTCHRLLGAYRLFINGQEVAIGPGRSGKRSNVYDVVDVGALLKAGAENVIAAQCYHCDIVHESAQERDDPGFLLQMKIFHPDSASRSVVTDTSWKTFDANSIYNPTGTKSRRGDFYQPQEFIDARRIPFGWKLLGFDDSLWPNATVKSKIDRLTAKRTCPLELHEQSPVQVVDKGNGSYFIDFGKEIMGGIRLTLNGQAGKVITVRLGEELSGPQTVRYDMRTENYYCDDWTLRDGLQTIEHHEYSVFRYGEILFLDNPVTLTPDNIKAWVVRYPFDARESDFNSSDRVLNDIWNFCKYTIQATTLDMDTDGNTRERIPYEMDACYTALARYSVSREWLIQRHTAEYLFESPCLTAEGDWLTDWVICTIQMAYADYMETGDPGLAERYYDILKKNTLVRFLNDLPLLEKPRFKPGFDMPSMNEFYDFTPINTVINAWACHAMKLLAQLAGKLGHREDAKEFADKHEKLKQAINQYLFDGLVYKDGRDTGHSSLHANIYPLAFGLVPASRRSGVVDFIKKQPVSSDLFAAFHHLNALYHAGEDQAALEILTNTKGNSWGHMIYDLGATTTCEAWDPAQKHNMTWSHPYAAFPAWIIRSRVMGIEPLEAGYEVIQIKPQPGNLKYAGMDAPCIKGTIHVDFKVANDGLFLLNLSIPPNTRARVYMPKLGMEDGTVFIDGALCTGIVEGNFVILDNIGSGTHRFERFMLTPVPVL